MKQVFKCLWLFGLLLSALSCEVQLEDNTRILAKGTVVNQDGLPITGAKISVQTRRGNYSGGENQYVLGEGYSDNEGHFSVISFFDKDEDFAIQIDAGDAYSTYVYKSNTVDFIPLDLTFDIGAVNLKKLANFNFNIAKTSDEPNSISFSIKYVEGFCLEYYEGTTLIDYQSMCYQDWILSRNLGDDNPNYETSLRVPFGETVEFTYQLNDAPEVTEVITINQDNYDLTFNY